MAATDSMVNYPDDQIAKDLPELIALLTEIKEKMSGILPGIDNIHNLIDSNEISTGKGISFLEMKLHLSLDYVINLVYLMLMKLDGIKIAGSSVVDRLTEIRTVIEKIKPVDLKLKYQIDKLLKLASSGEVNNGTVNPLSFKPNPGNLAAKAEVRDEDESADEKKDKSGIYVPPKVSAMPYDDDTWTSRKRKLEERRKQKTLNSSLLKDLREEYSQAPEEIREDSRWQKSRKEKDEEVDRERYEEDNLIRLNVTKRDKKSKREGDLKELTKFGGFGFDDNDGDDDDQEGGRERMRAKKSKKMKGFGKGKKKKFKMKRKKH
eukprot:gene19175-21096_t